MKRNRMMVGVCLGIILSIFVGELWIKNYIEKHIQLGEIREKLQGSILIRKYHNKGAMLDMGHSRRTVVAAISVLLVIVAVLCLIFSLGQRGNHMLCIGLSLVLGGGFSNTYDRLRRKYVVDYVSFGVKWKWLRRIVFNLSDFCIIIGALLTAFGAVR